MLRTPGESPIVKTAFASSQQQQHQQHNQFPIPHNHQQQRSISATTRQESEHQNSLLILQHHLQNHQSRTGSVGVLSVSTPLHTQDVGVSIRLMQCLEASTYNKHDEKNKKQHNQNTKHKNPLVKKAIQQDVESRFRGSLRTTTLQTKEEDWKKRMESVKKIHEAKKAELHRKTQTHRLFKHFAFEQRMAALQQSAHHDDTSNAADHQHEPTENLMIGGSGEMKIHHAGDSTNLFPTTTNSLTKNQVEEFFSVPSFVRPLLSTMSHPGSAAEK